MLTCKRFKICKKDKQVINVFEIFSLIKYYDFISVEKHC